MSENCTHDCSSCGESCSERRTTLEDFREKPHELSHIRKVIGVVSGKGGVGKSMVASMLAVLARRRGLRVGILDADITGPSIPRAFGLHGQADAGEFGLFPVQTAGGISVISLNLLLPHETDPVVWRGPVIAGVGKQFWTDVIWGDVDCLFVDMPPGTGDVPLTVFQTLPVDGIVVVASPQELVGMIVEKAVAMADLMHIPVLGLVENMSFFRCPDCGHEHRIFGESHADEIAARHGIPVVCRVPLDAQLSALMDLGSMEQMQEDALLPLVETL